ncbi:MAG: thiamine pyrophosphate-dependent dehydrogenase E1 component subunit alpha, partial [Acidimicrobiia bacterium]
FAIVGAGMPVAAGVGLAAQVKGRDDIGVAVFGDGAANIGAFHESLNLAAIWRLPVVFVCENNQYGEYSRISKTTPIADIAVRASSYDIPSEIVDGQDVLAVESAMAQAVARAREGNGPTLLEMKTYRYAGHSRSDEALYRPAGELEEWKERDPIGILADHIMAHGGSGESLKQIESAAADRVRRALESVLAAPPPSTEDMLKHIYAGGTGSQ